MNIKEEQFANVPIHIEEDISVRLQQNDFHSLYGTSSYHWIKAPSSVCLFVQQQPHWIGVDLIVGIQLITGDLPWHVDFNSQPYNKYVYLIQEGGIGVVTQFEDESVYLKSKTWYYMDVTKRHRVLNVTGKRIALTVSTKKV